MRKKQLRKKYLSYLREISSEQKKQIELNMYERLWNSVYWQDAKTIGITWSQPFEWNTLPIIKKAWSEKKRITLPKVVEHKREMAFYEINDVLQVQKGYRSIMEPNANDDSFVPKEMIQLLIVPGIVFTYDGYRIGFGGGYYDKFLVDFEHETVALCSEKQIVTYIGHETHDQKVNVLITERRIIETNSSDGLC